MKTQKTFLSLTAVFGILLFISSTAWAATSPSIFYSDLTSGPNTGGQNNAGVFVTIWGNNFGSSQGSSTVTVGGGTVANIQTWTNTEICFQLGASAVTGNIVVTTSSGTSNGIPFTVRNGNIYFVQPGASSNGSGTYASPFSHLWYAYNIITAGDTVYVMSGTITDEANGYTNYHSILCTTKAGTQASPIAWVAYPNATPILKADYGSMTWTDGSSGGGDTAQYIFNYNGGDWNTFSKFTLQLNPGYTAVQTGNATGWRVVGNNITASSYSYAIVELGSNSLANNTEILGNEIHDSGAGQSFNNEDHSIYWDGGGANVEIAWNYLHGNTNIGWEISCFHQGQRNGSIHDNLIIAGSLGSDKGILLGDVDGGESESTEEASTYNVYNNVLVNLGQYENGGAIQAVSGTAYIYNNTIYGSGIETMGVLQFPTGGIGPGGGHPVWYVANNIIVANNSGLYLSDENGNTPTWSNFALLTNNNYYGEGNGPSQDAKPLNANPQFVTAGTNFQLQVTSPDINAGYNTISIVAKDFNGLVRSSAPSIGAYEYTGSTSVLPSSPVVAITSPSTGISITAGSNVTITTTASETNGTISKISLYNGAGALLGSSNSSPYNYVMTNAATGIYIFTAIATDANGVSTTSSLLTITVVALPVLPSSPVVNITNPSSGSTYTAGSNVTITTTASETNGTINNISLYNGSGVLLGSKASSPYSYVYSDILAGGYSFYAVATDANGVSTTSSAITVTVTAPPAPVVAITSPTSGSSVTAGSNINITASASENNGTIAQVQFFNGTTLLGTSTTSPYTFSLTSATAGTYSLTAVATDTNNVPTTSSAVTVTVTGSTTPVVDLTSPANEDTFSAGSNITITASASVGSGSISKVSFYNGSTLLVTDTTSPYTYTWTNVAAGNYSLTAKAYSGKKSVTSSAVAITVTTSAVAPSITTQPVGMTVTAPATASFSVVAAGTPAPTYQWMQSVNGGAYTNISGATGASYTTGATSVSNNGILFKCVATNASGSVTSSAATLTVNPAPVAPSITTEPVSMTVTAPATASFSVVAAGTPAPTYQWMQSVNGGAYTNISGATGASYTTGATSVSNNGTLFKCVVTNASGSVTSNAGTLTVNQAQIPPSITSQPVSVTVTAPATATFSIVASGYPAPTYQWIQSVNGGSYTNINGATSASYTTGATSSASNGTQYACIVSNAVGSVISNVATLMTNIPSVAPRITTQPASTTVTAPLPATFSVVATGSPVPTYQWIQSVNGGSYSTISGATSASYTTGATSAADNGTQYACIVSNAVGTVISSVATLMTNIPSLPPQITTQPASITVPVLSPATFTVTATGSPAPTYRWIQSVNGGPYTNISGATSSSYTTVPTSAANNGTQYACIVNNTVGTVISSVATLMTNTPSTPPSITEQPASVTVNAPSPATFTVTATGSPTLSYQWIQSVNGGSYSTISGATSASYTTGATSAANNGTQYACIVSNAVGTVISSVATLMTNTPSVPPSILTQPVNVTVTASATATFSLAASGTPAPTYQWIKSVNGGSYTDISGATSASYTTPATTSTDNGTQYACIITNAVGSVISNAVTLTVSPS